MNPTTFRETLDAGARLMREGSITEAYARFEHAVELAASPAERAEALSRLGRARATLGDFAGADQALRDALKLAEGQPPALARARLEMGTVRWMQGELKTARGFLEDAHNDFKRLGLVRDRAQALGNLAVVLLLMGEYQRTIDAFRELITLDESLNDLSGVGISASNLGECYFDLGALDRAEEMFHRAINLAELINAQPVKADPLRNLARIQVERGDLNGALELVQESLALTETYQRVHLRRQALVTLGEVRLARGELAEARQAAEALLAGNSGNTDRAQAHLLLGRCALAAGDATAALLTLEQGLLDAQASFYTMLILRYHAALGQIVEHAAIAHVHRRIALELAEQLADSLTDKSLQQTFLSSPLVRSVMSG
jgi:tetratricopeptide (TPR) repeat protein